MPDFNGPQHERGGVHAPYAAHVPAQRFADRLENPRAGFRQRGGLRQDARHGMLRGLPLLGPFALRDVGDETAKRHHIAGFLRADGQFNGKLAAVAAQGAQLDEPVQDRAFAGGQVVRQAALVRLPILRRYNGFRQFLSGRFSARPAEHVFGPGIPIDDPARRVDYHHGAERRIQDAAQAFFAFSQGLVLPVDLREHVVEGVGEKAHFILAQFCGTDGIIPAVGNGSGGLCQRQDGSRDLLLQHPGKRVSDQQGNGDRQKGDSAVEPEPLVHGLHVGFQIKRAQALVAALLDRLKARQVRALETIAIVPRRCGKGAGRQVRRIF